MDPVTVFIILMSVLAGGGAGGVALAAYREHRRREMRRLLGNERTHDGRSLSLFDVFWDLGANDIALEMMRHHGLLPEGLDDGPRAHGELAALVDAYEGYGIFVEETLEVIEEFEEALRNRGDRRNIPTLKSRGRKLLPVDGEAEGDTSIDTAALVPREFAGSGAREERLGHYVDEPLDRRVDYREMRRGNGLRVHHRDGETRELIDVDDFAGMSTGDILGGILEGRFTETLEEWWNLRHVRSLKSDLDEAFEQLYDFYVDEVERRSNFYDDLFDQADRWEEEAERLEGIAQRDPLAGQPGELAADVLLEMAVSTARRIAQRAEGNTRKTIERIHAFARRGDFAMAGYLVYLNRNAFFAGRSPDYGDYVRRIENLAHRLKSEVRET